MNVNPTDQQQDPADDIPEFSIGITLNGAVLLMDGTRMTTEQVLERLKRGAKAEQLIARIESAIQQP